MRNIKFCVPKDVEEKILYKHGIELEELNYALEYGKPRIFNQDKEFILQYKKNETKIKIPAGT